MDEANWHEKVKKVLTYMSPERMPTKKKAAVGQSLSPSKQKTAAPVQLTRAPISQPAKKKVPEVFQEPPLSPAPQPAGPAPVAQEPSPVVMLQAELVPVAKAQPPAAVQQAGPAFQTFQEVDPSLAKKLEGWQVEKQAEAMRKYTKEEKGEQFQKAVRE